MARCLPRHRLDHRKQILGSMGQLAQQKEQMGFALLSLGDVE
jgi:hypothetical protein